MKLNVDSQGFILTFKGGTAVKHTAQQPFAEALVWNLAYKSRHGHFEVKHKEKKCIPLDKWEVVSDSDTKSVRLFSDADAALLLNFKEENGSLKCVLQPEGDYSWRFTFPAKEDEAVFGGGEQFRQLNMKGEKIINFVSEHIVVKPIVQQTIFKVLPYREKSHSEIVTYSPMTTFVTSSKTALRFKTHGFGVQDFTAKNQSVFTYEKCPTEFIFVLEDDFKSVSRTLNADTPSRQYLPEWCREGMIIGVQGGIDRAITKAEKMLAAGAAVSGVWCQDWCGKKVTAVGKQVYWNWEADNENYANLKERIAELSQKGVRFLAYINPYLVKGGPLYRHFKENGYLIKNPDGEVYHIKSTTFDAGMIDLTNEKAVKYLQQTIIQKNMLDIGVSGYMADFGEYLPPDSVLSAGDAKLMHNHWPALWAKINREAIDAHPRGKEVFFFTRSGYNDVQKYTPIMWNGDQHTCFYKDYGMPCVMPATFNLGFSGVPLLHSDIGGFISFLSLARDSELFVRWMEMNTFSPLMRSHETIRPEANAQYDDEDVIAHSVRLSNLHKRLSPYITYCVEQSKEGIPVMRPDFYNSGDYSHHQDLYSYFLGDEVFVAPVIEKSAASRSIILPKGTWVRFSDKKEYSGGKHTVDAPLGGPVAFYLKGGKHSGLLSKIEF